MARPKAGNNQSSEQHKTARAAVLALHNALAAVRQHPDSPELWRPAQRRAVASLQEATARHSVVLGLRSGAVYVDDEAVLHFHPNDRPFGQLRAAGIGSLVLSAALPAAHLEQLLQQLTAMSDSSNVDGELTALIDAAHIPGITLQAAADLPCMTPSDSNEWHALPQPASTSAKVRAMIQRDGAANLPALVARQLFDDSERSQGLGTAMMPGPKPCGQILASLLERILLADDIATTTWLLTELERRPAFDSIKRQDLLQMAREHCSTSWLQSKLERGTTDELLQLSALVMQLGDDIAENFAAAAAAIAHPLTQWLGELLSQNMESQEPAEQTHDGSSLREPERPSS